MTYFYNNQEFPIIIKRKNNRNTYIRVNEQLEVVVTTSYFTSLIQIKKLIDSNHPAIDKMIAHRKNTVEKFDDVDVILFGKRYDVIYSDSFNEIDFVGSKIFVKNKKVLDKYINKYMIDNYQERLDYWYQQFEEIIPVPNLKLRKMKSRWGVCNLKNKNVTLNTELLKYDIKCLDYVIVHELSHFIHPNHSRDFWLLVSKYYKQYKEVRKILKS